MESEADVSLKIVPKNLTGDLVSKPVLTAERAKKLLADLVATMQSEMHCGGNLVLVRDKVLHGWGFADKKEFEDALQACVRVTEDAFLKSWVCLYSELARVAEPPYVAPQVAPELLGIAVKKTATQRPHVKVKSCTATWHAVD